LRIGGEAENPEALLRTKRQHGATRKDCSLMGCERRPRASESLAGR
jgi:hypothetical protein